MARTIIGYLLIVAGIVLIYLRARKKGDISLAGGPWTVIEKIGDAVYIVGILLVIIGGCLVDESLIDTFKPSP